jgi:NAD(P)-dependent dehydrogenase (short-subunit alcohol dehydrogenase family)
VATTQSHICAGVLSQDRADTPDGFDLHFQVNYLGHFLLTQLLLPLLTQGATAERPARVICTSSSGHAIAPLDFSTLKRNPSPEYNCMYQYGQSKICQLWHALELDRRYSDQHVCAFAVHPGLVPTALVDNMPAELKQQTDAMPEVQKMRKSTEQGAATAAWAALSQEALEHQGKYVEDCTVAVGNDPEQVFTGGYAVWAYEKDGAAKLWDVSSQLVQQA